ncbi:hypothetical protein BN8_06674 [Fibrisoma limi BUZ 3]|uniref:Uncharacterized protein n=1 Tax=Fibrisoma limi BUZ 3 TaxID=1185876 RepID=I2GTN4_9BACT|nr:hypothetical protein BN8_06674 [Fibrisoma limi BUZ 3]
MSKSTQKFNELSFSPLAVLKHKKPDIHMRRAFAVQLDKLTRRA